MVSPPEYVALDAVTVKGEVPVCAELGEWFGVIASHWPTGAPAE